MFVNVFYWQDDDDDDVRSVFDIEPDNTEVMDMIEVLQRLTLDINNLHSHMHRVQFDLSTLLGDVNSAYLQTSDDSLNTSFQAQHDEKISLIHSLSRLCDAIGLLLAPMMYQHVQAVNKLAKKSHVGPKAYWWCNWVRYSKHGAMLESFVDISEELFNCWFSS
jgi:hypothetical protein